ncbi:MAG: ATP phosphoribosyltransferase regulatory subunit [Candidatus Dormibacteraeota bacterium]|nr:ATP phosphoribosyltransferase regulatory subunit [Candidatus Dormibacteraeota bacterium]
MLAEMRRWGYRYVVTPSLERVDLLALGLDEEERRRLFKLVDQDGSVLGLVSERTVPVARLVADKLRGAPLPLRLCYAGPVLSNHPEGFSRQRETQQVGAELIGASGPIADSEVIALAVQALAAAGLRRYQVDVGHSGFFMGLLEGLKLPEAAKAAVKAQLVARDFVGLEAILNETPLRREEHQLLLRFPALRGGPEILDAAAGLVRNRRSDAALSELRRVHELLALHGLEAPVSLDLGAIRDFDYYTGVTFEGYGPDLGRPLAQGGRYDTLLARFGRPAPATGFVIHLDRVGEALQRAGVQPDPVHLEAAIAWSQGGLEVALRLGQALRGFGLRTVVSTEPRAAPTARSWATGLGARGYCHVNARGEIAVGRDRGWLRLSLADAVAQLAGTSAR